MNIYSIVIESHEGREPHTYICKTKQDEDMLVKNIAKCYDIEVKDSDDLEDIKNTITEQINGSGSEIKFNVSCEIIAEKKKKKLDDIDSLETPEDLSR